MDTMGGDRREIGQRNEIFLITRETNYQGDKERWRGAREMMGLKNGGRGEDHCVKKGSVGKIILQDLTASRNLLCFDAKITAIRVWISWFYSPPLPPFSKVKNMDTKNYVSCGETARLIFQTVPPSFFFWRNIKYLATDGVSSEIRGWRSDGD